MRLATWNVNSIRSRIDRVTDWLQRGDVDVLAMQETKCTDAQFPTMPFAALGYDVVHHGHNQWNGVAIASRVGLDDDADRGHLSLHRVVPQQHPHRVEQGQELVGGVHAAPPRSCWRAGNASTSAGTAARPVR